MTVTPELGQLAFGNPWGDHACPQWCDALVREILREIERVFWNRNQRQWDGQEDPGVPGVEYRPYYWGLDEVEAAKPNLKHGDVEVRWYKHPMRSSSLNVEPRADVMIPWFESAIAALQAWEVAKTPEVCPCGHPVAEHGDDDGGGPITPETCFVYCERCGCTGGFGR